MFRITVMNDEPGDGKGQVADVKFEWNGVLCSWKPWLHYAHGSEELVN